jgi:hypothetical protein
MRRKVTAKRLTLQPRIREISGSNLGADDFHCFSSVTAGNIRAVPPKSDHTRFVFLMGWDWAHLVLRPLFGLLYQPRMIDDECGAVGGMRIGRRKRYTRRKPAPVPFRPPQVPYNLTRARTRAAAVENQRLTAWSTAYKQKNFEALVRKRTIPTERPPLVGEVSANFSG